MFDFLRRAATVLRRPWFREAPALISLPEPVTHPAPVQEPTLEDLHERLRTADLRLHVSVEKTHRGANIEYHVGPADHPFQNRFANRTVSFKIPQRFQEGLRQHLLDSNPSPWELKVPQIGFIDYQFERFAAEGMRVAISGAYQPKVYLKYPARAHLAGLGTYLEFAALKHLKKLGVTHLRTSFQMVSDKRVDQLQRRGLSKGKTYSITEWARRLASRPRPRAYRASRVA